MGVDSAPTYPVLFRLDGAASVPGSLTVTPSRLVLDGGVAGARQAISLELSELREIRIARLPTERINGHRVLVLTRASAPDIYVAPLGPGLLHEIADLTARLAVTEDDASTAHEIAIVAVTLRPGAETRARELAAAGPPFDPAALRLTAHRILFHDGGALFVFAGDHVRQRIGEMSRQPALWRAGLQWRGSLAGAPRLLPEGTPLPADAELVYDWPPPDR